MSLSQYSPEVQDPRRQRIIACMPDETHNGRPARADSESPDIVPAWVTDALNDTESRAARRLTCHEVSKALLDLGRFLWANG
jgi:hypothetical protein